MSWIYGREGVTGRERRWVREDGGFREEKPAITAACEKLIAGVLKPRFLPAIRPTEFNYPVDIYGRWHGQSYRFLQRYRSGYADNIGEEFEQPFARLEWFAPNRFDVSFFRHTGHWFTLHRGVSLQRGLDLLLEDGLLHPL